MGLQFDNLIFLFCLFLISAMQYLMSNDTLLLNKVGCDSRVQTVVKQIKSSARS